MVFLGGCQKPELEPQAESVCHDVPFTLTATCVVPETKLTFDEDGLGTTWQPGDKLYLVDVAGKKETVTLTTSITAPSKKASFKSTAIVSSGEYIVLYGSETDEIKTSWAMYDAESINSKNNMVLYGTLNIAIGQTSATISVSHAYARLTFKFFNLPSELRDMDMGMAVSKDGVECDEIRHIGPTGFSKVDARQKISFGWNNPKEISYVTIAPFDLSKKEVYFYVSGYDGNHNLVTYEFVKKGVDIKAGINYNILFDFRAATKTVLKKINKSIDEHQYSLTTPAEFRAASYAKYINTYFIDSDVDFEGETYFPIKGYIYGQNHTLSNVFIDLEKCSVVGILSEGRVNSLSIKNCTIKGRNTVGGIGGYVYGRVEACTGSSIVVSGNDRVGGLFGVYSTTRGTRGGINNCFVTGNSSVSGMSFIGGLVGYCYLSYLDRSSVKQCAYEGKVEGDESVGGIVGKADGLGIYESFVKGDVSGKWTDIGGIAGTSSDEGIYYSYIIGNVTASKGTSKCGGISGYGLVMNCYSYGNVSSGFGITSKMFQNSSDYNLTSSPYLGEDKTNEKYCNCGPDKTFVSLISVLNGGEKKYSTQVWKGIDAQCPLLQWQADLLNGDIDAPGFGNEDW